MRQLIASYVGPDDLILDPFAGVAPVGVACLQTGRRFVGIEIDHAYHAVALRHLAEANNEVGLFAGLKEGDLFPGGGCS